MPFIFPQKAHSCTSGKPTDKGVDNSASSASSRPMGRGVDNPTFINAMSPADWHMESRFRRMRESGDRDLGVLQPAFPAVSFTRSFSWTPVLESGSGPAIRGRVGRQPFGSPVAIVRESSPTPGPRTRISDALDGYGPLRGRREMQSSQIPFS